MRADTISTVTDGGALINASSAGQTKDATDILAFSAFSSALCHTLLQIPLLSACEMQGINIILSYKEQIENSTQECELRSDRLAAYDSPYPVYAMSFSPSTAGAGLSPPSACRHRSHRAYVPNRPSCAFAHLLDWNDVVPYRIGASSVDVYYSNSTQPDWTAFAFSTKPAAIASLR
ncbi:hypothetical protein Cgig2_016047 [Carnegiea gigantea]|uniref:Uncharacterized protein n=1 Tax=Carnegiea gigantea TaxID=171969 RepID=A0A9Q1KKS7_9CARY|nr:hypothetical protein Cgig2_016047 [Carnegiea gigantea]